MNARYPQPRRRPSRPRANSAHGHPPSQRRQEAPFPRGPASLRASVAEIAAHCVYRVQNGRFIWRGVPGEGMGVFQPHPYLAGVPRPGARGFAFDGQVEINAQGYRGPPLRDGRGEDPVPRRLHDVLRGRVHGRNLPEQLQKELSGLPSGPVDVVNSECRLLQRGERHPTGAPRLRPESRDRDPFPGTQ
jgi:hypothetical protein